MIRRPVNGIEGAFSLLSAILPIAVVAVATLVLGFALSMGLAIQVRVALKDVASSISPLPGDESMIESSFYDSKVCKNQAASPMRLVIFPISFIQP